MAEKRVALLKRANKLFRQGKADAAVKEYKKILAIKPDDLEVRRIVGDLQLRENNIPGAIEQFEWIADYFLKDGFFAKAIAMFKRITRVDPNYEGALFKLAELYTKQGLVMEAKQIYLDVAEECKRKNNQKKALDMYKKILEFDRSNIKMRLLLADNYLKEGLDDVAVEEYSIAADILINKKDFRRAEEILTKTTRKVKNAKLIEKLVRIYIAQGDDDKAIKTMSSLGAELNKSIDLLKVLGELYLKKNMMSEAEDIFTRIAEINPEETEVIMRLGKVYLQREEYDKTFRLFQPIVDKNIELKKYEDAASLLRFIIASNNSFLPALTKLANIFKVSGKTNNLIALYESLIPIYEQKNMRDQLKKVLEELIQLSDTPFSYEEQLSRLTGEEAVELEEEEQEKNSEREREFVTFNLRVVDEALAVMDHQKAIDVIKKAKSTFPKNAELRQKLFDIYMETEQNELAVDEGKGLLEVYKFLGKNIEHSDMVEKLSRLSPHDDKLVALSHDEKTSIEIDFSKEELAEQLQEINVAQMQTDGDLVDDDVLLLSDADNVTSSPLQAEVEAEISSGTEKGKSLSSILSEVDFYVNDGYFGDAEKLIAQLKKKYPDNKALLEKIKSLEQAKSAASQADSGSMTGSSSFEIEREPVKVAKKPSKKLSPADIAEMEHTERIRIKDHSDFELESPGFAGGLEDEPEIIHRSQDSKVEIDLGNFDMDSAPPDEMPLKLTDTDIMAPGDISLEPGAGPGPNPISSKERTGTDAFELETFADHSDRIHAQMEDSKVVIDLGDMDGVMDSAEPPLNLADSEFSLDASDMVEEAPATAPDFDMDFDLEAGPPEKKPVRTAPAPTPPPLDDDMFNIESSIAEESHLAQEHEDSKVDMVPEKTLKEESIPVIPGVETGVGEDLEIEVEESQSDADIPPMEIDKDLLIQSPSADSSRMADTHGQTSSVIDELDLDDIIEKEESAYDLDSPFKEEMSSAELAFESEEDDLLQGDGFFPEDEEYLEIENAVKGELEAIAFWLKELEKQRTSTIEKNMMEIFEEFKKGVDEKIGKEDYDTRYNLGIAYKEMGLLEEAIHEFMISSKHPSKFFDSAGLLGMCFRDKGMFSEAIGWFEQALNTPERRREEYLAIQFEMAITLKMKEDYPQALKIFAGILKTDPGFRNVGEMYKEIRSHMAQ
jgi:tetratricopeptide (TPR) repeat protein